MPEEFCSQQQGEVMQRMLDDRATIAAVKVLVSGKDHYPAIKALLARTKVKPKAVSATVRLLLAKLTTSLGGNRFMQNYDSLVFALELLPLCELNRGLIDTVVKAAAQAGFCGRFPSLPKRMLGRNPDTEEITLLVSAYVQNKAVQASDVEKKLEQMARTFLSEEEAKAQITRIRVFQKEWASHVD